MRIIAIVTCYNPAPELLLKSVASYAPLVEKLLVWRNSVLPEELESELRDRFKAEFRGDGTNVGISKALNAAWKEAAAEGYDCLLTMDQDSVWHNFDAFLSHAINHGLSMCFYSPAIVTTGMTYESGSEHCISPTNSSIISGSLIPISVLKIVGGWDEDLKIDAVDDEFCFHAHSLGIKSWECRAGWLDHRFGDKRPVSFLWFHFDTFNYPPERLYEIYRNHIIVFRRYKGDDSKVLRYCFIQTWVRRRPLRIFLGERRKWAKFHAIFRGVKDGFLKKI